MTQKIEVLLDTMKCQGYGLCLGVEDVFEIPEGTNVARLKCKFVNLDRRAEIEQAAGDCPAMAISFQLVEA